MMAARTLDAYLDPPRSSQDPEFLEVQRAVRDMDRERYDRIAGLILRMALEAGPVRRLEDGSLEGGITADDIMEVADPSRRLPHHLIGCIIGTLRSTHRIRVGLGGTAREKARHPEAKGRWLNRYELQAEALGAPPAPLRVPGEVSA
jgi:hypothetical protein